MIIKDNNTFLNLHENETGVVTLLYNINTELRDYSLLQGTCIGEDLNARKQVYLYFTNLPLAPRTHKSVHNLCELR